MLPPPTTMPTWTPSLWTVATWLAMNAQNAGVHPVLAVAEERLAGQLEEDAAVAQWRRRAVRPGAPGPAHSPSPTSKRTKRRTLMFSPILAMAAVISSPIVWSVSR